MHPQYADMRTEAVRNLRYFQPCKKPRTSSPGNPTEVGFARRKESLVYLGFSYDLARGMQDELLRWADEQRKIKRVRARDAAEKVLPRPPLDDVRPNAEDVLAERRAS